MSTLIKKNVSRPVETLSKPRTLGPVSDLERHLPSEWWRSLFNSLYLKTDGDVVENDVNTKNDIDLLIAAANLKPEHDLLDLCCGQGRHSLELARRGFHSVQGVDRSRYLIRLARKRARDQQLKLLFSEGDARRIRVPANSKDCIFLMGNSFGYFEREEDDLAVLESVKRTLRSGGKLVLDIVNGEWMASHFEARSWEWIDQQHFVNRERSLAADGKRIITREVITNAEIGILADQFYAERLYRYDEIVGILESLGFINITHHGHIQSASTRGQDLGMMAHRLFISATAPEKKPVIQTQQRKRQLTVLLGDPRLPDPIKKEGKFNEDDIQTVEQLKTALKTLETNYHFQYRDHHRLLLKELMNDPPEYVINFCDEGYHNQATLEPHIASFLEMLNIPYSGSGPGCLFLCYNKARVRAIAASMDIPVPLETYFDPGDQAAHIPSTFPALLKPACGDSSIGITSQAVVQNAKELVQYLDYLRTTVPNVPVLVQEFLNGQEYSVGLIGNPGSLEHLPILEVDYRKLPAHLPKILSYESKWHPESPYWTDIAYCEAHIDDELRNRLISYSRMLFERLECRDYARFDFRCDSNGTPKLLEVNPNPGWCWDGKLNLMAGFAGIDYAGLLEMIIKAALERIEQQKERK